MKTVYWKLGLLFLVLIVAGGAYSVQQRSIRALRLQLQSVENQLAQSPGQAASPRVRTVPATAPRQMSDGGHGEAESWNRRLARLEEAVLKLSQATDYLMERGELPPDANKMAELAGRFADASLSDRERIDAFRLLRRSDGLTDHLVHQAANWLQSATNAGTRRNLLQQMDGLTNAALKGPLLGMLSAETSSNVREEIVENLQAFAEDPAVEAQLWDRLRNDPDDDVREEAADALRRVPLDETRVASMQQRALQPDATLEEQLLAIDATRRGANSPPNDFLSLMGEYALLTEDPNIQERIFSAFDGSTDPSLKAPLIDGLQSPHPDVREEAADALSDFVNSRNGTSDPIVTEWLQYVAENDADPRVRREASRSLNNNRD